MSSSLQIAVFAGTLALLAGSASGKTGETSAAEQQMVSIRLYDKAQVPAAVLRSAMPEAARLFRRADIRITWERLSAEVPQDQGTDMTAAAFQQPDNRPYLVVRLIRHTPATVFPGALGYSLPFAHHGAHVLIFYDRVEPLAQQVDTAVDVILAHGIAHELGHVLLHSSEHSNSGMMQARWTPASWHRASEGLLAFRGEEIERMHARLQQCQSPGANQADRTPAGGVQITTNAGAFVPPVIQGKSLLTR